MRIILSLLLFLCFFPMAASAQENFTGFANAPGEERIDEQLGLSVPYMQQKYEKLSPVDQIKVKYYDYCMTQTHPMLFFWAKKKQCVCTANMIDKVMVTEDILAMAEDTERGKKMRQTMLQKAYAPCMPEPVQRVTLKLCQSDTDALSRLRDPEAMCGCVSDVVSRYVANYNYDIVGRVFYSDPENATPLTSFLSKKEFFSLSENAMKSCFNTLENDIPPYPGITPSERMRRDSQKQR